MAALYGLPLAQLGRMVSFLDSTGDGTVSRAEFDAGIARLQDLDKLPEGGALDSAAIWAILESGLDRDGAGALSLSDMAKGIQTSRTRGATQ